MGAKFSGGGATVFHDRTDSPGEIVTELVNASDGQGLHFDGAANIDIASPPDLGTKFSFEFIAQADSWDTAARYLVDFGNGGRFIIGQSSGDANLQIYDQTSWKTFGLSPLDDLKVHHLAVTIDGTAAILYDNGNQVATATISASHGIDSCADARIGSEYNTTNNGFDGTLYRTRFFNRTLSASDVVSLFENASVPAADRYGSQTELVVNGDFDPTTGWAGASIDLSVTGQVTWTAAGSQYLRRNDWTIVKGKRYRLTVTTSAHTTDGGLRLLGYGSTPQLSGDLTIDGIGTHILEFTALGNSPSPGPSGGVLLGRYPSGGTYAGVMTDVSCVEIGCVSDYDLAFANPTQSLMVQDRAGAADGTSSATGVVQVTPIEQLNSKSARIGTFAGTPADGELLVSGPVTVGKTTGTQTILVESTNGYAQLKAVSGSHIREWSVDTAGNFYVWQADNSKTPIKISAGGLVGIGGSPVGNLDVFDSVSTAYATPGTGRTPVGALIRVNNTDTTAGNYVGLDLTANGSTLTGGQHAYIGAVGNAGGYAPDIVIGQSTAGSVTTERMRIDSAGNVGIGGTPASLAGVSRYLYIGHADHAGVVLDDTGSKSWEIYNSTSRLNFWNEETSTNAVVLDAAGIASFRPSGTITNGFDVKGLQTTGSVCLFEDNSSLTTGRVGYFYSNAGSTDAREVVWIRNDNAAATGTTALKVTNDSTGPAISATGGIVEEGGVLKENLLTNSGFDVWSNSTLEDVGSDLVTNGTFTSNTTGWTAQRSAVLSHETDKIRVTNGGGVSSGIAEQAVTVTSGKLYKLKLDIKTLSVVASGFIRVSTASATAGTLVVDAYTGVADDLEYVFESPVTGSLYVALQVYAGADGHYVEFDNVSLTEVTPGCVAADALACDGWWKDTHSGLDIFRQHNDGGTLTHDGSFYSLKATFPAAGYEVAQPAANTLAEWTQRFAGRTVTFGCWMKSSNATLIRITDSDGNTGATHTGGGGWEWLEVTRTCGASITAFRVMVRGAAAETVYVSQPMLVFGSAIGSGNYSRPSGEIVWFEARALSNKYHNKTGANGFSTQPIAVQNVEADSNGKIPKGAKAVSVSTMVRDSVSLTSGGVSLTAGSDATLGYFEYQNTVGGIASNMYVGESGITPCDANGDIYTYILASGSNTFDIDTFCYYGVQLR